MGCERLLAQVDAYVDGELDAGTQLELEHHVAHCVDCRREATFLRALKAGVREGARAPRAPAALRERVLDTLDEASGPPRGERVWMGGMLAAAAALLFVLAKGALPAPPDADVSPVAGRTPVMEATPVAFLPGVVEQHIDRLPTEAGTERAERLAEWFRGKLGFRVAPVDFHAPDVRFVGARVSNVGNQQAAKLYYRVGDSRMTMVALEASPQVRQALARELEGGEHTRLGPYQVTVRRVRGYTVPVIERDGVIYAFTGDLDEHRLLQLVASASLR